MSSAEIVIDPVTNEQFMTFDDGTVTRFSADGRPLSTVAPDGHGGTVTTTYTAWDDQKRPVEGTGPDGHFKVGYDPASGNTVTTFDNGTVSTSAPDGRPLSTVAPDGHGGTVTTTYTAWDDQKRPVEGTGPDGHFKVGYDPASGNTVTTFDNGTVSTSAPDGRPLSTVAPDGHGGTVTTTYTAWDDQKRPVEGTGPDGHFKVGYDPASGNTVTTFDNGTVSTSSGDGRPLSTVAPDGHGGTVTTTYTAWDDQKRPVEGTGPDGHFKVGYDPASGNTVTTFDNGTVSTSSGDGRPLSTVAPDGHGGTVTTTYTAWDDQKRPVEGTGPDGHFKVGYDPASGNTVTTFDNGTVSTSSGDGRPLSTVAPDGHGGTVTTTYTAWDDQKRPVEGTGPDGHFKVGYDPASGNTVTTFDNGTVSTSSGDGRPLSTVAPDGHGGTVTTTYTAWDDQKRPVEGTGPDGHFKVGYDPASGNTVTTFDNGTVSTSAPDGRPLSTVAPDGHGGTVTTTYTAWDDQKRPVEGTGPDGHFKVGYDPASGNTVTTFDNGTVSTSAPDGRPLSTVAPDGHGGTVTTTYTAWDDQKRPVEGTGPDGHFKVGYDPASGNTVTTFDNGTVSTSAPDGRPLSTVAPDGHGGTVTTTYTAWDDQKRPVEGTGPDGHFKVGYDPASGNTITTFDNGTVSTSAPDGRPLSTVTPDGHGGTVTTTYTAWDDQKRPVEGTGPDGHFTMSYPDANSTVVTMDDHSSFRYANGELQSSTTPEGVTTYYTNWDNQHRPTEGNDPDGHFTIAYGADDMTITYVSGKADKTKTVFTKDGKLISTTTPDGEFIDWRVELNDLLVATRRMPEYVQELHDVAARIASEFKLVNAAWSSPASASFVSLTGTFQPAVDRLTGVAKVAESRLRTTYLNIVNAETISAENMPKTLPPPSGS